MNDADDLAEQLLTNAAALLEDASALVLDRTRARAERIEAISALRVKLDALLIAVKSVDS